jgi:hypothetical protein
MSRIASLYPVRQLRSALRRTGIDVYRVASDNHLVLDYPVSDQPRYGRKTPPHAQIKALLDSRRGHFGDVLRAIADRRELLDSIPDNSADEGSLTPHWNNDWFTALDACVLMHFILEHRPRRFLEIGSGTSTIFAHHAVRFGGLETKMISIDPHPRRQIDALCSRVIRNPLEDTDLSIFDELEAGDILFLDGSHRLFTDSDATVFFLDVLPRLKPGVLVHIHDIFWPCDYPAEWGRRYYSEQYALGLVLLFAGSRFETLFPCAYVSRDAELGPMAARLTNGRPVDSYLGVSYWLMSR